MIGVLVLAPVIVILQNTGDTKLQILFFDVACPLWLLLTVFATKDQALPHPYARAAHRGYAAAMRGKGGR